MLEGLKKVREKITGLQVSNVKNNGESDIYQELGEVEPFPSFTVVG